MREKGAPKYIFGNQTAAGDVVGRSVDILGVDLCLQRIEGGDSLQDNGALPHDLRGASGHGLRDPAARGVDSLGGWWRRAV